MSARRFASFDRAPRGTEEPTTRDALLNTFLSSLPNQGASSAVCILAAVRHFLHWLEQRGIVIASIDDRIVRRFERHRCRCPGYSAHGAYKLAAAARVRRFVRFLEDHGFIDVSTEIDGLGDHLAAYSALVAKLRYARGAAQIYRSEAEHFASWMRVSRQSWDAIDTARIEQYAHHDCRCPVYRKRGRLVEGSGTKRRRRGALRFVEFLRDQGILAAVEPATDMDPRLSAYSAWLKQHRGATDATIRRFRDEVLRLAQMLGEPSRWDAAVIRRAFARRSKQTPGPLPSSSPSYGAMFTS